MEETIKTLTSAIGSSAPSSSSTAPASSTPTAVTALATTPSTSARIAAPADATPPSATTSTVAPTPIITTTPGAIDEYAVTTSTCCNHATASPAYTAPTTPPTEATAAPTALTTAPTSRSTPTALLTASTPTPKPNSPDAEDDPAVAPPTRCSTHCFFRDTNMLVPGSTITTISTIPPSPSALHMFTKFSAPAIGMIQYARKVTFTSPCPFSVHDGTYYDSVVLWPPPFNRQRCYFAPCVFDRGKSNLTITDTPHWTLQQACASISLLGVCSLALLIELKPWPNWRGHQGSFKIAFVCPYSSTVIWVQFSCLVHKVVVWPRHCKSCWECCADCLELLATVGQVVSVKMDVIGLIQFHIAIPLIKVYYCLILTYHHQSVEWKPPWISLKDINSLLTDKCLLCLQSWQPFSSGQLKVLPPPLLFDLMRSDGLLKLTSRPSFLCQGVSGHLLGSETLLFQIWLVQHHSRNPESSCPIYLIDPCVVLTFTGCSNNHMCTAIILMPPYHSWLPLSEREGVGGISIMILSPVNYSSSNNGSVFHQWLLFVPVIELLHLPFHMACFRAGKLRAVWDDSYIFLLSHKLRRCRQFWKPPWTSLVHRFISWTFLARVPNLQSSRTMVVMFLGLIGVKLNTDYEFAMELSLFEHMLIFSKEMAVLELANHLCESSRISKLLRSHKIITHVAWDAGHMQLSHNIYMVVTLYTLRKWSVTLVSDDKVLLCSCNMRKLPRVNLIDAKLIMHWAEYNKNHIFLFWSLTGALKQMLNAPVHGVFLQQLSEIMPYTDQQEARNTDCSCSQSALFHPIVIKRVEDTLASSTITTCIIFHSEEVHVRKSAIPFVPPRVPLILSSASTSQHFITIHVITYKTMAGCTILELQFYHLMIADP